METVTPEALKGFLDKDSKLKSWPSRKHREKQLLVLEFLADKFEAGREYSEKEVNEILNQHHTFGDPAMLRRELFMKKLLDRTPDGSRYWKPDKK
ncbi:MAG: DUF2087 domain-containing protein [candidate division Zixibacteria bacterium]|nr:DUF2087 domain-containing protein [candidate division Zixibacteria bacterium]